MKSPVLPGFRAYPGHRSRAVVSYLLARRLPESSRNLLSFIDHRFEELYTQLRQSGEFGAGFGAV
jgi:hypothetical protein